MVSNELPEKPKGGTRHLLMHLNFGPKGGAATYEVKDAAGEQTPIGYQYDTRKDGLRGFTLPGIEQPMSWEALRKRWPKWLQSKEGKEWAATQ